MDAYNTCEKGIYCRKCRSSGYDNRQWRLHEARVGNIPVEAVDGDCPFGVTIGNMPDEMVTHKVEKINIDKDDNNTVIADRTDIDNPFPVGDWIAKGLSAIGIKSRKGCGCKERQEALNRMGRGLYEGVKKTLRLGGIEPPTSSL